MKVSIATMENSMEILQKLKTRITIQPSSSTSGYLSEGKDLEEVSALLRSLQHYSQGQRY